LKWTVERVNSFGDYHRICTRRYNEKLNMSEKTRRNTVGALIKGAPPVQLNIIPPRIVTENSHGQYTRKQILRFWGPCITSQFARSTVNGCSTREPSQTEPKARVANSFSKDGAIKLPTFGHSSIPGWVGQEKKSANRSKSNLLDQEQPPVK
jgi:hypothetical protein